MVVLQQLLALAKTMDVSNGELLGLMKALATTITCPALQALYPPAIGVHLKLSLIEPRRQLGDSVISGAR
jgi:hypothetical protein